MKKVVNVHEAKTHLSRLLDRVTMGEEFILAKAGIPVAKLIPYREERPGPRSMGRYAGKIILPDDFFEPDEELLAEFEKDDLM